MTKKNECTSHRCDVGVFSNSVWHYVLVCHTQNNWSLMSGECERCGEHAVDCWCDMEDDGVCVRPEVIANCAGCGKKDSNLMRVADCEHLAPKLFHLDCYVREIVKKEVKLAIMGSNIQQDTSSNWPRVPNCP